MDIYLQNDKERKSIPVRIICDSPVMQAMLEAVLPPNYCVFETDATVTITCTESPTYFRGPGIIIGDVEKEEDGRIYLSRPLDIKKLLFSLEELTAHSIRNVGGGYVADSIRRVVSYKDKEAALTVREFELFMLLSKNIGEAVSREHITKSLWPDSEDSNVCDVYVTYLRRKLEVLVGKGSIISVRGQGYMLSNPGGI